MRQLLSLSERCDTRTQAKGPEWPYVNMVSIVTPYRLAAEPIALWLKDQSGLSAALAAEPIRALTQAKGPEWPYVSIVTPYRQSAVTPGPKLEGSSGLMSA
ncbi:hypothetical protein RRG08_016015 [Elysia crispata]|uniref:Uncharacterized protein n=1 Tax=Elysia crispata TaxID=231223 RepID=A0AAE0YYN7_9GAST|nr:hypothetical protein RRG08_016015 [Elysia crispata]